MKTLTLAALMTFVILGQNMYGQFNAHTTISSMYDDNVNNNALQLKSNVSILNFNGGYSWDSDNSMANVFYDGSFTYYESLLERTNHFHSINADYTKLYGDDNQNALNMGGLVGTSLNRDAYTIFDHSQYSAFINYKYFVADWMINKGGYTFRTIKFATLSDFSYTEHSLFAHAAFSVTPTTTFIMQTDIGSKFYSSTPAMANSSMRKGVISSLMPSVTQLIGMVKIGQRITEEIGLNLTERYQWNLQKQTRYLSSEYGFISDDELFDDHYGYEGLHSSATLTALLSESMTLKLSGGIQNKLYSSLSAFDLSGNIVADQRMDTRTYINIGLQRNFEDLGISLKGSVDIIQNTSNDSFYDYKNNAFTLELGIPF
jgi:hypothetical protein